MPSPPREPVNVRIGQRGREFVTEIAEETSTDISKVIRAALVLAARYRKELVALLKEHS